jgi:hypothetical protein
MKTSQLTLSASAFVAIAAVAATPSRAETEYRWCAVSSTGGLGQPLCHFVTLDQCMAFLSGLAGTCRPNPRPTAPAQTGKSGTR